MAKKTKKNSPEVTAVHLGDVRKQIAELKTVERELTKELLSSLHEKGLTEAGDYRIVKADTFKVIAEELALPFALERGLTRIDTSKVKKVFQLDTTLRFADPTTYGFERVTQEKISPIRGAVGDEE